jgi:hypothetical protein
VQSKHPHVNGVLCFLFFFNVFLPGFYQWCTIYCLCIHCLLIFCTLFYLLISHDMCQF